MSVTRQGDEVATNLSLEVFDVPPPGDSATGVHRAEWSAIADAADRKGFVACLVTRPTAEASAAQRRYHDLEAAVMRVDVTVKSLRAQFDFTGERGHALIERLAEASELLREEVTRWRRLYR